VTAAGGPEWPEPPVPEGVQPPNHPQIANTIVDVIRHGFMWLSYFRFFGSGKVRINLSGQWNLILTAAVAKLSGFKSLVPSP
jgi:hypothetical protein